MSAAQSVPVAAALAAVIMTVLWHLQQRQQNANVVDVGWTFLVGALAVFFAAVGEGWAARRLLIGLLLSAWSLRLGIHLLRHRVVGHLAEDGRYRELRRQWGPQAGRRFFVFFQTQGLAALFFALPSLIAASDSAVGLRATEIAAIALWTVAFAGEFLADRQLAMFKRDPAHRGRTCTVGLWRYSRHPNYFFEFLMWIAYALFAWRSPWGPAAALCPAAMLFLLLRVTGIPAAEAQALRSRGDEYRRYQQSTSVFVPWWPA